MLKIFIPTADIPLVRMQVFAAKYSCTVRLSKTKGEFEITTDDVINFFWLGANMAAAFLQTLNTPLTQGPQL